MPKRNVAFKMRRDNYATKYLKNVLRSLGMSTKEYLADIAPNITETAKTGAEISKNIYMSINRNKAGINRVNSALQNNRYLKAMKDAYKNALTDLKTGNLNNQDRAMEAFMGESGSDGFSFGDDDLGFGDESTNNINVDTGATQAVISMTQQSRENTASQIKMMKASTDAIIASSTISLQASQQLGTDILGRLDNINNNLASIVKYQSENMTKFIEASIAYYDKAGQAANQQLKEAEEKLTGADVLNSSKGGINMSRYKQYVKQQLKKTLSNSSVGFIADMLDDDMLSMISSNPLGFATKALTEYMMPKVVTESIKSMEQAYSNFAPTMLAEISKLSKSTDTGLSGMLKRFIGDTFGIKGSDPNDRKIGAKIQKGPTPFDNETKIAITQIITKELREQTSYLRVLTEKIGGTKGYEKAKGYENYFDYHEGRFYQGRDKIDDKIANEIIQSIANGFSGTKFGQSLNSLAINQSTDSKRKEMQKIIDRIYVEIEKNKDNVTLNDVLSIVTNLGLNNRTETILKNYIENMARKTPDDFNSLNIGRLLANQQADRAVKDISQNYQDWNLLSSSFNAEALSGPDSGKEIRRLLDESFKRNRDNNVKRFRGLQIRSNNTLKEDYGKNPIAVATGYLVDSMNSILSGNLGNISNLTTNFFKDELSSIAKRTNVFLFGKKTSTKEREGGVFSEVINKTKDYLFGNVVDETGKRDKSGFFGQVTSGWMEGIFGKKKDNETDEEMHERVIGGIKDKANKLLKEKFPEFFKKYGKDIGVGAGAGLIASVIGGPIAGATVGIASGLVSHSGMVGRFLFGEDYTDKKGNTKHRNGLFENIAKGFSKGNQHKVTKKELGMNLTGMLGGALTASMIGKMGVIGAALTPLGPLGGAILGLGASISAQSGKLHEMLFGKDVTDSKGNKFHEAGIPGQILNQFKANIIKPLASTVTTGVNRLLLRVEHHILTPISLLAGFVTKRVTSMFTGGAKLLSHLVRGITTAPFKFVSKLVRNTPLWNTLSNIGGFASKVGGSMLSLPGRFIGGTLGLIGGKELRQQWNLSQEIFRDRMKALNAERKAEKQRIRQDQAIAKLTGGKFGEDTMDARMYLSYLDEQSGGRTKLRENFEKKFGKESARDYKEYKEKEKEKEREREAQDAEIQQRDALIDPDSTQNKLLSGIKDSIVDLKDSLLGMFRGLTRRQDSTDTRINHVEHQRSGLENIISNFHRSDDDSFEMESGGHGIGSTILSALGTAGKAVGKVVTSGAKKIGSGLSKAASEAKAASAKVLKKAGLSFKPITSGTAAADGTSVEELAQAREKEEEHNFRAAVIEHFEAIEENQGNTNATLDSSISPKSGLLSLGLLAAIPIAAKVFSWLINNKDKIEGMLEDIATIAKTVGSILSKLGKKLLEGAKNVLEDIADQIEGDQEDSTNDRGDNATTLADHMDNLTDTGGALNPSLTDEDGFATSSTTGKTRILAGLLKSFVNRNNAVKTHKILEKIPVIGKIAKANRISETVNRKAFQAGEKIYNKGASLVSKGKGYIDDAAEKATTLTSSRAAFKAAENSDNAVELMEAAQKLGKAETEFAHQGKMQKAIGKLIEAVKTFFSNLKKKIVEKFNPKYMNDLEVFVDDATNLSIKAAETHADDCVELAAKKSAEKTVQGAASVSTAGIVEIAMIATGAIDGVIATQKIFQTTNVDKTMMAITALYGAAANSTIGGYVDIIIQIIAEFTGFNLLRSLSEAIYKAIHSDKVDKLAGLDLGQAELEREYHDYREAEIKSQYESYKNMGKYRNMTLEEFKEASNDKNSGVKLSYLSKEDWLARNKGGLFDNAISGIAQKFKNTYNNITGITGSISSYYYDDKTGYKYYKGAGDKYSVFDNKNNIVGSISADDVENREDIVKKTGYTNAYINRQRYQADAKTNALANMKSATQRQQDRSNQLWDRIKSEGVVKALSGTAKDLKADANICYVPIDTPFVYYKLDITGSGIRGAVSGALTVTSKLGGTLLTPTELGIDSSYTYSLYGLNGVKLQSTSLTKVEINELVANGVLIAVNESDIKSAEADARVKNVAVDYAAKWRESTEKAKTTVSNNNASANAVVDTAKNKNDNNISEAEKNTTITLNLNKTNPLESNVEANGNTYDLGYVDQGISRIGNKIGIKVKDNGGNGYGGAGESLNGGTYFSQNDSRWKDAGYNTGLDAATMGTTGCGPTALSMAMSDATGSNINPMQMAGLAKATGNRDETGTNWNFIGQASSLLGVPSVQSISPSADYISSELDRGNHVLLSGKTGGYGNKLRGGFGESAYTPAGHYIVAVGKDEDGNILVNDPRGKSYSRKYDPEVLAAETGSSWSFGGNGPLDVGGLFNNGIQGLNTTLADTRTASEEKAATVSSVFNSNTPDVGQAPIATQTQTASIASAVPAAAPAVDDRGYSSSRSGIGSEGASIEAARARATSAPAASKWNPHAGMAYEPGKGAVNNKGLAWMDVVRACKKAISEASGGKYSQKNYVKITMDGVEYSVRTDCSGFVSFCLKVMGILANNVNLTSSNFTSSCTTLTNNGFTYMDWPGWEGLKEGDIIAEPGSHVEIFSRHDGNDDYVYNVGSNSSASAEGETKDGHTHNYKTVFRPDPSLRSKNGVGEYATGGSSAGGSEDGSGATADSSSDATVAGNTSGASEQKEGIWSKLTTGISNFMSAAFDRMVSGDWSNTNYDDVFYPNKNKGTSTTGGATSDGSSSGSSESSGSSSGGSTSGGTEAGSSSCGAISMYNVKSIKNIAEAEERLDSLGLDNKKRNFYKSILPATMQSYSETGVLPSLTLAQGAIESGWGESGLAKKYNNYFGMKAGKSWKGAVANLKTKEEYKAGSPVTITDGFRVYSSPSESVLDHGKLLTNPRYAEVINRSKALDAMGAVQAVKDAGYATSSTYVQTVGGRVKGDKLYELDKFTPVVGDSGDKSSEGYSTSMSGIGSEGANLEAARARAQGGAGISIPKRKLNTGGRGIGEAIAQLSQNNPFTSVINGLNNNLISKSPSIIQNGNIARNNTNINTTPGMGATNQQVDLSQVINLLSQLVTYSASSDTKLDMLGALNNIQGGNNLFVANGGNGGPNKWMMSNPNGNTAMRRGDSIAAAIATGGF